MLQQLSFLKDASARILFLIFLANFFYDDPTLYLYKRLIYSVCIYIAIWEIAKNYYQNRINPDAFKMPVFYNLYIPLVCIFIFISLSKDILNPNLNWVTLLNNPYSLLSVGPIFLFVVGANTRDIEPLYKVLIVVIVIFTLVLLLPVFGRIKYYQGYISAVAFLPFFFISVSMNKYKLLSWCILFVGLVFGNISDYRSITLRILLFISLYIGFSMFKKYGVLKLLIIIIACTALYQFIANMENILLLFKEFVGVKSFDDDDTRGFLWRELFSDMHGIEFIFGRGFLGTYFSEYFLMLLVHYGTFGDHYERFTIEVGFLELLLKGGFFWYILYIIPILYASIKGIFWHYENKIVFLISIYLLTELFLMFVENIPYFCFQYSLIFFLAGFAVYKMTNEKANPIVAPDVAIP